MEKQQKYQQIHDKIDYIFSLIEEDKYNKKRAIETDEFYEDDEDGSSNESDSSSNRKPSKGKSKKKSSKGKSSKQKSKQKASKPKAKAPKQKSLKQTFKNVLSKATDASKKLFPSAIISKAEEIETPKSNQPKQLKSNNLGEMGDILQQAKNKDIEFEKIQNEKIEQNIKKYNSIQNEITNLNNRYEKAGFFEKGKILAEIAYEKTKLAAMKATDFVVDKAKQASHILDMGKSFISSVSSKISSLKTKIPEYIVEFYKSINVMGKGASAVLKKIPLIGSILSVVFGMIDLAQAKTNKDVRMIFGGALGSSIGGIIGFAVGSVLTPIVGAIVSIITAFIGEWVGKQLSFYGIEPMDFIPFDCYDLPLEAKMEILQENMKDFEIPSIFYDKDKFDKALKYGIGLETQETGMLHKIAKSANTTVETIANVDIDGDGNVNNVLKQTEPSNENVSINPDAVDGAVIQVNRTMKGKDFKGRDFVGGTISIIDSDKRILYSAATIERGEEGLASGKNLRIPPGTYNLVWHYGSKHSDVPKVYNDKIPQSRAILLHKGWSVSWTAGCVVFAKPEKPEIGKNSQATFASDERKFVSVLKQFLYNDTSVKPKGEIPLKLQIFNNFEAEDLNQKKVRNVEEKPQEIINNKTLVIVET